MIHAPSFIRVRSLTVLAFSVIAFSACGPRGESHTVDQILTDSRSSYQVVATKAAPEASGVVKSLAASLDRIAGIGGGGDARAVSREIADALTDLSVKAGYTARPAIAELINQYRAVASDQSSVISIGAPNLKLLAARTYSMLAAELGTSQFKL